MSSPAEALYNSLNTFQDLENLMNEGASENLVLECKSPQVPSLDKKHMIKLATAVSGFGNTAGGVSLYGMATSSHGHKGIDILSQIEPIANCNALKQTIENKIPTLSTPSVTKFETKTIKEKTNDRRGVIAIYFPQFAGDPLQSMKDNKFYYRSEANFVPAPHEMIKRLFFSSRSPDLGLSIDPRLVKEGKDGGWIIPLVVENKTNTAAREVSIQIEIENYNDCESVFISQFSDVSHLNPEKRAYGTTLKRVIHRGLNIVVGQIRVKMKKVKRRKRTLHFNIAFWADNMRARKINFTFALMRKGFTWLELGTEDMY